MNLGEVIEISLDLAVLLTPACGGRGLGMPCDDSEAFIGEAFSLSNLLCIIGGVYLECCKRHEASGRHLQDIFRNWKAKRNSSHSSRSTVYLETCQRKTKTWVLIHPPDVALQSSLWMVEIQTVESTDRIVDSRHAAWPLTWSSEVVDEVPGRVEEDQESW